MDKVLKQFALTKKQAAFIKSKKSEFATEANYMRSLIESQMKKEKFNG